MKNLTLLRNLFAIVLTVPASSAYALTCVVDIASYTAGQSMLTTLIKAEHATTQNTVANAVKIARNALADAIIFNAKSTRETLKAIEIGTIGREYAPPPYACVTEQAANSLFEAEEAHESEKRVLQVDIDRQIQSYSTYSRAIGSLLSRRFGSDKSIYSGDTLISASSLLHGAIDNNGEPTENLTSKSKMTYNDDDMKQALAYIETMMVGSLPDTALQGSREGKAAVDAKRTVANARASMAASSFAHQLAFKAPSTYSIDMVPIWEKMGFARIVKDASRLDKKSGQMSMEAALSGEVDRRFLEPKWYAEIASAGTSQVSKESIFMKALELKISLLQNKNLMRIEQQIGLTNLLLLDMLNKDSRTDTGPTDPTGRPIALTEKTSPTQGAGDPSQQAKTSSTGDGFFSDLRKRFGLD